MNVVWWQAGRLGAWVKDVSFVEKSLVRRNFVCGEMGQDLLTFEHISHLIDTTNIMFYFIYNCLTSSHFSCNSYPNLGGGGVAKRPGSVA
jgi:hypothetical protein